MNKNGVNVSDDSKVVSLIIFIIMIGIFLILAIFNKDVRTVEDDPNDYEIITKDTHGDELPYPYSTTKYNYTTETASKYQKYDSNRDANVRKIVDRYFELNYNWLGYSSQVELIEKFGASSRLKYTLYYASEVEAVPKRYNFDCNSLLNNDWVKASYNEKNEIVVEDDNFIYKSYCDNRSYAIHYTNLSNVYNSLFYVDDLPKLNVSISATKNMVYDEGTNSYLYMDTRAGGGCAEVEPYIVSHNYSSSSKMFDVNIILFNTVLKNKIKDGIITYDDLEKDEPIYSLHFVTLSGKALLSGVDKIK